MKENAMPITREQILQIVPDETKPDTLPKGIALIRTLFRFFVEGEPSTKSFLGGILSTSENIQQVITKIVGPMLEPTLRVTPTAYLGGIFGARASEWLSQPEGYPFLRDAMNEFLMQTQQQSQTSAQRHSISQLLNPEFLVSQIKSMLLSTQVSTQAVKPEKIINGQVRRVMVPNFGNGENLDKIVPSWIDRVFKQLGFDDNQKKKTVIVIPGNQSYEGPDKIAGVDMRLVANELEKQKIKPLWISTSTDVTGDSKNEALERVKVGISKCWEEFAKDKNILILVTPSHKSDLYCRDDLSKPEVLALMEKLKDEGLVPLANFYENNKDKTDADLDYKDVSEKYQKIFEDYKKKHSRLPGGFLAALTDENFLKTFPKGEKFTPEEWDEAGFPPREYPPNGVLSPTRWFKLNCYKYNYSTKKIVCVMFGTDDYQIDGVAEGMSLAELSKDLKSKNIPVVWIAINKANNASIIVAMRILYGYVAQGYDLAFITTKIQPSYFSKGLQGSSFKPYVGMDPNCEFDRDLDDQLLNQIDLLMYFGHQNRFKKGELDFTHVDPRLIDAFNVALPKKTASQTIPSSLALNPALSSAALYGDEKRPLVETAHLGGVEVMSNKSTLSQSTSGRSSAASSTTSEAVAGELIRKLLKISSKNVFELFDKERPTDERSLKLLEGLFDQIKALLRIYELQRKDQTQLSFMIEDWLTASQNSRSFAVYTFIDRILEPALLDPAAKFMQSLGLNEPKLMDWQTSCRTALRALADFELRNGLKNFLENSSSGKNTTQPLFIKYPERSLGKLVLDVTRVPVCFGNMTVKILEHRDDKKCDIKPPLKKEDADKKDVNYVLGLATDNAELRRIFPGIAWVHFNERTSAQEQQANMINLWKTMLKDSAPPVTFVIPRELIDSSGSFHRSEDFVNLKYAEAASLDYYLRHMILLMELARSPADRPRILNKLNQVDRAVYAQVTNDPEYAKTPVPIGRMFPSGRERAPSQVVLPGGGSQAVTTPSAVSSQVPKTGLPKALGPN